MKTVFTSRKLIECNGLKMTQDSLATYISTLSEEEKIRFKDLIAECLERDSLIRKSGRESKENLGRLVGNLESLARTFDILDGEMKQLSSAVLDLYLKTVPVERLFKSHRQD